MPSYIVYRCGPAVLSGPELTELETIEADDDAEACLSVASRVRLFESQSLFAIEADQPKELATA